MEKEKNIITKIEVQKRNKERVNIYIDEEFSFACSGELVYNHSLSKGKKINCDDFNEIVEEDNFIKCKSAALKIIEKTYKTESQIKDKLIEKGYLEKSIDRTLKFLKEYKFLDDDRFVELYIKEKIKSQGKKKIKHSLVNKGINEFLIEEKLKVVNSSDEEKIAKKLAEKKYAVIVKTEKDKFKVSKKIRDYLYRNGYNSDIIQRVLNETVNQQLEEETYEDDKEENIDELRELAEKRYNIIIKSEKNTRKIYKKLGDYLLRRGYSWENIKKVLNTIVIDCKI